MVDRKDDSKSVAPIKNYAVSSPVRPGAVTKMSAPAKLTSRRKRHKKARQTTKGALNLRRVAAGVLLFLGVSTALYIFFNPSFVPSVLSGQAFERTETCSVTATNTTYFFDTTCGVFKWDTANLESTPGEALGEGQTYVLHSVGFRAPILGVYPDVIKYEPVG